jgi:TolA-binding protein
MIISEGSGIIAPEEMFMRIRTPWLFFCFALTAPMPLPAQGTGGTWNTIPSMNALPPPPVRVSGKVALEDKSPPPLPAMIERVCDGQAHPEGPTDSKGSFAVDLGHDIIQDPYAIHIQPGIDMPPAEKAHPFQNCLIRASLPGYRSDLVPMSTAKPEDHPYLGTIVLHFVGKASGWLISPTSREASKAAQKAFDSGQQTVRKNKQPDAIKEYQKAVELYPGFAVAWFELGRLQAADHQADEARRSFSAAIKADPKYLSPFLQLAALVNAAEDWTALADVSARLLQLDETDYPQAYFYNAHANYRLKKLEPAESSARAALRIDTEHQFPDTYRLLASILVARGQQAAAVDQLETFLKLFPRSDDAVMVQADILRLKNGIPQTRK